MRQEFDDSSVSSRWLGFKNDNHFDQGLLLHNVVETNMTLS